MGQGTARNRGMVSRRTVSPDHAPPYGLRSRRIARQPAGGLYGRAPLGDKTARLFATAVQRKKTGDDLWSVFSNRSGQGRDGGHQSSVSRRLGDLRERI